MFKNYILVATRNLFRNRIITFVNISGLAFGLLCSLMMFLWIWDEVRTDGFHQNQENIYQVFGEETNSGESIIRKYAPSSLAEPLKNSLPEIKDFCRSFPASVIFETNGSKYSESGIYADPSIFKIFSFPLKEGNPQSVFNDPKSVVISSQLAQKYFPGESALGKNLGIIQQKLAPYVVTGVMSPIPSYSSLQFDFVLPYSSFENEFRPWWGSSNPGSFTNFNVTLYFELESATNVEGLNKKLGSFIDDYTNSASSNSLFVFPFKDVYLHSDFSQGRIPTGRIKYIWMLSVIAVLIFLIACINFVNLSTAVAGKRAKEIGLRKVIGATRRQLLIQFYLESILTSAGAMIIALTFIQILLPFFNLITQKQVVIPFNSPGFYFLIVIITIMTGLMAGAYPSWILSSFEPLKSLTKRNTYKGGFTGVRRILVFVQFTLSISFIIYTLVIYKQVQYIYNKDLGIRKGNILSHSLHGIRGETDAYKNELLKMEGIQSVTFTEQDPFQNSNRNAGIEWEGKPDNSSAFFNIIQVSDGYLETFDLQLISGRDFTDNYSVNNPKQFIINKEAAQAIGVDDPVGMNLKVWGNEGTIVGIVNDYHHQSLMEGIEPVIIVYSPDQTWNAYMSLESEGINNTLDGIKDMYLKFESEYPFDYYFVDEKFKADYNDLLNVRNLSNIFSIAAIVISCLGLFGLSAFMIEQKKMETGIRKVLGAKQAGLVYLFSMDFIKLVLLSFAIAAPLSWVLADYWLSNFTYHTNIGIGPFLIAGLSSLFIALLTVSYNTIRATVVNPVDLLRYE